MSISRNTISLRTLVSTFAGRTMPTHDQNLQKSFQVPAREKRNFKKCPTAQEDKMKTKTKRKIKHDCPTMAIRNAGDSADMKVITLNKLTAKRKVKCFEIPHYA